MTDAVIGAGRAPAGVGEDRPALYAHPFSSYCQKALTAFYENGAPFTYRRLSHDDAAIGAELHALWPLGKFPVLVDRGAVIPEATIIIEYLDLSYPGPARLVPADAHSALDVRFMDRFLDNHLHAHLQRIVFDAIRPESERDARGVSEARAAVQRGYGWLENHMAGREWAAGDEFSLADCAAAPALFYLDWVERIGDAHPNVRRYRERLNARPSFARCIEEARPYRELFPLGAPDRD